MPNLNLNHIIKGTSETNGSFYSIFVLGPVAHKLNCIFVSLIKVFMDLKVGIFLQTVKIML